MKKFSPKGIVFLIGMVLLTNFRSYAQIEEVGNMVAAGADDAKVLLQPYIAPAVNAFGAALSGGWFNTAEPHKLGGFDITFTANVAFIPKSDKTFLIDNNKLTSLKLAPGESNETQTVGGDNLPGSQLVYNVQDGNGNVVYSQPAFRMPQGLNASWVPAPMVQAGIGLIKGTDVMFRYFPNISYKENELGLWGIGGRHDIKQWIPGLKRVPVFKMSILYGFTKLHTFINMNIDPGTINAGSIEVREPNDWNNQFGKIWVKSQTVDLLLAADLKVITFYGSLGIVTTKTDLKFEGDFPVVKFDSQGLYVDAVTDPLGTLEIKNTDGSFTKPRFNVGMRFKLAIVTIHFDYSWANYSVLTGGLGFSFR